MSFKSVSSRTGVGWICATQWGLSWRLNVEQSIPSPNPANPKASSRRSPWDSTPYVARYQHEPDATRWAFFTTPLPRGLFLRFHRVDVPDAAVILMAYARHAEDLLVLSALARPSAATYRRVLFPLRLPCVSTAGVPGIHEALASPLCGIHPSDASEEGIKTALAGAPGIMRIVKIFDRNASENRRSIGDSGRTREDDGIGYTYQLQSLSQGTEITAMVYSAAGLCRETSSVHPALFMPAQRSSCPLYKYTPIPAVKFTSPPEQIARHARPSDALKDAQEAAAPCTHAVIPITPESGHEARTYICHPPPMTPLASAPRHGARVCSRHHVAHAPAHPQNQERRAPSAEQHVRIPREGMIRPSRLHAHTVASGGGREECEGRASKGATRKDAEARALPAVRSTTPASCLPRVGKLEAEAPAHGATSKRPAVKKGKDGRRGEGRGGKEPSASESRGRLVLPPSASHRTNTPRIRPHPRIAGERSSGPPSSPRRVPGIPPTLLATHQLDLRPPQVQQNAPGRRIPSTTPSTGPRKELLRRTTKKKEKKRTRTFTLVPSASVCVHRGYAEYNVLLTERKERKAKKGKAPEGRWKERTLWDGEGETVGAAERLAVARAQTACITGKDKRREDEGEQGEPGDGDKGKMEEGERKSGWRNGSKAGRSEERMKAGSIYHVAHDHAGPPNATAGISPVASVTQNASSAKAERIVGGARTGFIHTVRLCAEHASAHSLRLRAALAANALERGGGIPPPSSARTISSPHCGDRGMYRQRALIAPPQKRTARYGERRKKKMGKEKSARKGKQSKEKRPKGCGGSALCGTGKEKSWAHQTACPRRGLRAATPQMTRT
ncbi:hypothetical protein C8F04DRAFT_1199155 [Mycena alexandri]|uniref:Uncharacterized protein n=1 Tax=Mycena alexandri TaxID=1745969 RepID=A0AAD6WMR9_9AGAR|nr:hypothetical protein C8F04DRAFT_1199155 [Mycena alexandri]